MRGVDFAFERLQPVALLDAECDDNIFLRHKIPFDLRQRRRRILRAHIGPEYAIAFDARIGFRFDTLFQPAAFGLGRHVQNVAFNVEFLTVVDTADTTLFISSEHQWGAAMRAGICDQSWTAVAIAKGNEILAENFYALGLPVCR